MKPLFPGPRPPSEEEATKTATHIIESVLDSAFIDKATAILWVKNAILDAAYRAKRAECRRIEEFIGNKPECINDIMKRTAVFRRHTPGEVEPELPVIISNDELQQLRREHAVYESVARSLRTQMINDENFSMEDVTGWFDWGTEQLDALLKPEPVPTVRQPTPTHIVEKETP